MNYNNPQQYYTKKLEQVENCSKNYNNDCNFKIMQ